VGYVYIMVRQLGTEKIPCVGKMTWGQNPVGQGKLPWCETAKGVKVVGESVHRVNIASEWGKTPREGEVTWGKVHLDGGKHGGNIAQILDLGCKVF
jgi:hypothetical protein